MKPPARLRRTYFDCRYGQLHVHQAIPPGGGFDEATALLCLPGARGRGGFFKALLAPLGADRSIYAPDLPGHGESDSAGASAGAAQFALAMADLLDSLRQRQVDLLAHGAGAQTALALATLRPDGLVRRVVFSAAAPAAVSEAGRLGLDPQEINLAAADDEAPAEAAVGGKLADLIRVFGSAGP